MKKISLFVVTLIAAITLVACTTQDAASVEGYYVAIDINPSIEFVVDENDNVESFIFLNEDAAILCVDLDFTGMNIDDAVELFIQTATEAGYVDPEGDDNAVLITVLGDEEDAEAITEIKERIRDRVNAHFARQYINATVLTEEFTQEDLVAQADELGVTPGKLKLALVAQTADETLVLDDLLNMPVKDLLAIVRELHEESFAEYKETQMEQLRAEKQERIDQFKSRLDEYIAEHPDLTDEEIQAIVDQAKEQVQTITRERWQERLDQWQQQRDNNDNDNSSEESNQA